MGEGIYGERKRSSGRRTLRRVSLAFAAGSVVLLGAFLIPRDLSDVQSASARELTKSSDVTQRTNGATVLHRETAPNVQHLLNLANRAEDDASREAARIYLAKLAAMIATAPPAKKPVK